MSYSSPHFQVLIHYSYVISPLPCPFPIKVSYFRTDCNCISFWTDLRTRHMFRDKLFLSHSQWFMVFLSQSVKLHLFTRHWEQFLLVLLNLSIDKESIDWGNLCCTRAFKERMMSKRKRRQAMKFRRNLQKCRDFKCHKLLVFTNVTIQSHENECWV